MPISRYNKEKKRVRSKYKELDFKSPQSIRRNLFLKEISLYTSLTFYTPLIMLLEL